jgi:uncharacterized protein
MVSERVWRLRIYVRPRASQTRVVGRHGAVLKVQVRAAPVDGAANAAVIDLLAQAFGIPSRAVRIVSGRTGREKIVEIQTRDPAACQVRLAELMSAGVDKAVTGD